VTELRVHLPDDVAARLAAEAAQRGTSTEDLAAEVLTDHSPAADSGGERKLGFIGIAASGRGDIAERAEEIVRAEFGA
jgi:plasmid stability protein